MEVDLFKEEFKYFKRRDIPVDLSKVIDLTSIDKFPFVIEYDAVSIRKLLGELKFEDSDECEACKKFGLNDHNKWKVYGHSELDGLFIITNPFTLQGQAIWIRNCLEIYPYKPNITNIEKLGKENEYKSSEYFKKLRWATVGYHHNWDTKVYSKDRKSPFPNCLYHLIQHISSALGNNCFVPQAGIINYYQLNSTLNGHVDYSEPDLTSPIFSISLGQNAIFLIGGKTKAVRPLSFLLRSGDIVVMSGESRLCYHGIPKILRTNEERWNFEMDSKQDFLTSYIKKSRININVRQVLAKEQDFD